ncbi:hypothetical protein [Luteimonas saliphila]|uniref:hypothetical protein n=1 Tax=Luteimonas saliphila TaxID=2804919 RepID=UPI00192DF34A|nr:hypothetical protein [Luteimonas saliphila]
MRIQTVGYPAAVLFAAFNDGANYFRLQVSGFTGRTFRVVDADIDTAGFYDNVLLRGESGFTGTPTIYLSNGTDQTAAIFSGAVSSDVEIRVGGGPDWGTQLGNFALTLEVETGVATGEFVPLAESGLSYAVLTTGSPNIEAEGGPEPPASCFWTDLVRVSQTGCEPAP